MHRANTRCSDGSAFNHMYTIILFIVSGIAASVRANMNLLTSKTEFPPLNATNRRAVDSDSNILALHGSAPRLRSLESCQGVDVSSSSTTTAAMGTSTVTERH